MPDLYPLARPLLFALEPEKAHHATIALLKTAHSLGALPLMTGARPTGARPTGSTGSSEPVDPVDSTAVEVMGLAFPNRVGLAAGLDKAGEAVGAFGGLGFGHVEIGTVTPRPQPGNAKPRLFRLKDDRALINRMGFNNPGVDELLENLERSRGDYPGVVGINIGKNFDTPNERALEDYVTCLEGVYGAADYVTANLSSPNTVGLRDLQHESTCRELIERLQAKRAELAPAHGDRRVPIVVKIAPDLAEDAVKALAAVFGETGVDGVITTNTTINREAVRGHPFADEAGGLSGAPLTEKATAILSLLRREMDDAIPVIGSGGVMSAEDARAKFDAGAALVQVYTGLVYRGPSLVRELAAI